MATSDSQHEPTPCSCADTSLSWHCWPSGEELEPSLKKFSVGALENLTGAAPSVAAQVARAFAWARMRDSKETATILVRVVPPLPDGETKLRFETVCRIWEIDLATKTFGKEYLELMEFLLVWVRMFFVTY